jgi:hypothetical protein
MSINSADRFGVDTDNYLGFQYESYKRSQYAAALTKYSDYAKIREDVIKSVQRDAVGNMYKTISAILISGKDLSGNQVVKINGQPAAPNYPAQDVSKIALAASETLNDILLEVVEKIMPSDHLELAYKRMKQTNKEIA